MANSQHFRSLKGHLLLDGGNLAGSFFHRSVVLVCEHTSEGAFGVVLNRPGSQMLGSVVDFDLPTRLESERLYGGGPVAPEALCYLYVAAPGHKGDLAEQFALGHDFEVLIRQAKSWTPDHYLRIFQGYSGWAPGQLDDELGRAAWITHPASTELVFKVPPGELWRHILRRRPGWKDRLLAEAPEDLSWN